MFVNSRIHAEGSKSSVRVVVRRPDLLALLAACSMLSTNVIAADVLDRQVRFDIPAEPLSKALMEFARAANIQLMLNGVAADGHTSAELKGVLRVRDALETLIRGSGLSYKSKDNTVTIAAPAVSFEAGRKLVRVADAGSSVSPEDTAGGADSSQAGISDDEGAERRALQEITITGSYIRGTTSESVPLTIYDRSFIEQTGATTLAEFGAAMPENVDSANNFNVRVAIPVPGPAQGGSAASGASGFNIHGLGPEQTLTLLNGHRIADAGATASFVDVSVFPVAAIKQIEVLTDGASAIYGSDAVAGVVNIILRDDFTGAQSTVQYGAPTRGGGDELTASQLVGTGWDSGHAMLAYQYNRQNSLDASDRDFVPTVAFGKTQVVPEIDTNSAILTASQAVGDSTSLSIDALYGGHTYKQNVLAIYETQQFATANDYAANLDLTQRLGRGWEANVVGSYSKVLQNVRATAAGKPLVPADYDVSSWTMHADADGPIASLAGGDVKIAVGAEYRHEGFINSSIDARAGISGLSRHIESAFAEMLVPLVGGADALPGMERLQLTLAGRYDDYSDFGSTVNPHAGILWAPTKSLSFRGTYARSYRAPRLDQSGVNIPDNVAFAASNPSSPTGKTNIIVEGPTGNPSLEAETSRTYTAGFDLRTTPEGRLRVSGSYFHILFENEIASPPCPVAACYFQPYNSPFLNVSPTPQEIAALFATPGFIDITGSGQGGVRGIFDSAITNLSRQTESGVDFSASYDLPLGGGDVRFGEAATYIIKNEFVTVAGYPPVGILNGVGEPLKFRARTSVGWSLAGFSSLITADYRNSYDNAFFAPSQSVSSWTTVDLRLGYHFADTSDIWALKGVRFALTVSNLFDRNPPVVNYARSVTHLNVNLGYDPVNANPLGRVVALSVDKKW